tara:strand:+ start:41017 stop:42561 length:1545 start_codon:yes stop_codon:yes gene_type:complete
MDCQRLATRFLLITAFAGITLTAAAQDPWQLAVEDLPPLDFPGPAGGGSAGSDVPPYRLPLPNPKQSDSGDSAASSVSPDFDGAAIGPEENGLENSAAQAGEEEDWVSEETMYNEPEEYQIGNFLAPVFSSSDWYRNGTWYVNATAEGIWRSSGKPKVLAKDLSGLDAIGGIPVLDVPIRQITTRHKGFRFEPGLGLTLGRFLGRDYFNRDASVEFGFLGLLDWQTNLRLVSASDNELFTALNLDGPGGSSTGRITIGGSLVPLGLTLIPGFDAVNLQEFEYSSDFNSFEVNVRLSHRPGRDRMVAMPDGTWSRQLNSGGVPSFFAGMRYIGIKERLLWLSQGNLSRGTYDVETGNKLFGLQFGGNYTWETKSWSAGVMGKAGAYVNFANLNRNINGTGDSSTFPDTVYQDAGLPIGYQFATNLPNLVTNGTESTWSYRGSRRTSVYAAFLESKLFTQYNVNPNLSFRMSWDQFWINGLAMAPYQLHFEPARAKINAGGNVYFTGLSLAGQWVW